MTLAQQFGYATGKGEALRTAGLDDKPDPMLYSTLVEPHERGAILVAAVFDAFFSTYQLRIADLVRIATGGTGRLPEGDLHPDLVRRIAREAAATAQSLLTMCIRAFEYLPPVDITYSDYLRALVTADHELTPDDPLELRNALIEAFRVRGVELTEVRSLSLDALKWPNRTVSAPLPAADVAREIAEGARRFGVGAASYRTPGFDPAALHAWAVQHSRELDLDPARRIQVHGFHSNWRVTREGGLKIEVVAQFVQRAEPDEFAGLAGVPFRGGVTVVADADGFVRFVISKTLPKVDSEKASRNPRFAAGLARLERLRDYIDDMDLSDPRAMFDNDIYFDRRQGVRANIAALHRGLM